MDTCFKLATFLWWRVVMISRGQYMDVKTLRSEGVSIKHIAKMTGLSRNTVRRILRGEHPLKARVAARESKLDAFKSYLHERFQQYGLSAVRLHAEISAMGYTGSEQTVRRYLAELRALWGQARFGVKQARFGVKSCLLPSSYF